MSPMRWALPGVATLLGVLLVAGMSPAHALASTGELPDASRQAAVQALLDRVLGPGSSTVIVTDTVRTSSRSTTTIRYGTATTARTAQSSTTWTGTGSTHATARSALVGSTTTATLDVPGAVVQRSVSVVVDGTGLHARSMPALRRLINAAAGVVRARGDRVSIVVTRFAKTAAVHPVRDTLPALALPVLAGLLAVLVLLSGLSLRRNRQRRRARSVTSENR